MYIPFENLPEESRIWIYQSNRKFSDAEFSEIETDLQLFLNDWAAHGTSLESSYLLKYNRFIVLAVNQEEQLEKIITQKWIACWPEGMEAWTEQRRTGYPKLFKVQTNNSNGTIDTDIMIRRLPFSQDDAKKDPEQYKNLCTALGGADNGGTRLWWDTGKNNF